MTEGIKHDDFKPKWHLLSWRALAAVVDVATHGAMLYGEHNWQLVDRPRDRYFSALMRHLVAWREGERRDQGSGYLHLAHAAWNAIALLHFELEDESP